jgi:hypothetical protein
LQLLIRTKHYTKLYINLIYKANYKNIHYHFLVIIITIKKDLNLNLSIKPTEITVKSCNIQIDLKVLKNLKMIYKNKKNNYLLMTKIEFKKKAMLKMMKKLTTITSLLIFSTNQLKPKEIKFKTLYSWKKPLMTNFD